MRTQYFYHKLIRKYVILFGNMFNDILIVRKDNDTGIEVERFKVPIMYSPKEKYITRLESDPDLQRDFGISLPRMSFEMTSISYDPSRKQNSLLRTGKNNGAGGVSTQYMGVPYDIGFELNIYTRNIDDGNHIVEQILPFFNPDHTPTINPVSEIGVLKDTPIILNSVTNNIQYEGNFDSVRYINWTLTFTMKAYFYGPVSTPKIIRKVDTNIYNDPSLKAGYITRLNLDTGNSGDYKLQDIVYQGNTTQIITAYGRVNSWDRNLQKLTVAGVWGQFIANDVIRAVSSNATYNVASFDESALKLVNIHIEPKPNTANPGDDYGYSTTITEWPFYEQNAPQESFNVDSETVQADSTTITADKE